MADYKPSGPFIVPLYVFIPKTTTVKGSNKKVYPATGELIFCTFRTFGGTEIKKNDVLVVENTAVVETWFRPDINANCKIVDADGVEYEILGTPENIGKRNQYLVFKMKAVRGGA